jgi:ABC-2 type transport system permease protein
MTVGGAARYFRLLFAMARYELARELSFRGNFLVKVSVEVLWLGFLLIFYHTVFGQTDNVRGWNQAEYLFFVGCFFLLGVVIETFFLSNCSEFAELVRSGDLDFHLLRPIDEQFLLTCGKIDWSTAPNLVMGLVIMADALGRVEGWAFDPLRAAVFVLVFACGVATAYSFLVALAATSVWLVRNQSLYELWWLFTSVMRYPREIFGGAWTAWVPRIFLYLTVLLVVDVPVRVLVKDRVQAPDPVFVGLAVAAAALLLWASRKFFRLALSKYRSASS